MAKKILSKLCFFNLKVSFFFASKLYKGINGKGYCCEKNQPDDEASATFVPCLGGYNVTKFFVSICDKIKAAFNKGMGKYRKSDEASRTSKS